MAMNANKKQRKKLHFFFVLEQRGEVESKSGASKLCFSISLKFYG